MMQSRDRHDGFRIIGGRTAAWALALLVAAAGVGLAANNGAQGKEHGDDDEQKGQKAYAIGLWGDLPYSDLQALTGVPNLIADMNGQDLEFTVHDGDFKGGNGTPGSVTPTICSDAMYRQGLGYLNALNAPAMFTPGDNDWTDCDRPVERRLQLARTSRP